MTLIPQLKALRQTPVRLTAAVIAVSCLLQSLPRLYPSLWFFERLEVISYDSRARMALQFDSPHNPDLGAVFIDDEDLDNINANYQVPWPWPRGLHGRLVNELTAQGAAVIGFDILFRELHPDSLQKALEDSLVIDGQVLDSDAYFARTLAKSEKVVLAASGQTLHHRWEVILPHDRFRTNAWMVGHIMADADPDGVLRRARAYVDDPHGGRFWHLGILLAARYLDLDMSQARVEPGRIVLPSRGGGDPRFIPTDRQGYFFINWSMTWNDWRLRKASYCDLLQQDIARSNGKTNIPPYWRNKIVVVGSISTGNNVSDIGATPLSQQTYLISKHWNVANSILTNRFIQRTSYPIESLLIFLLASLSGVITWRLRVLRASFLLLAVLALYTVLAFMLFIQSRYWLPLALPSLAAFLTHVCLVTYRVLFEQKERSRVKSIFSTLVAPNVVNELLQADSIALGGTRRRVSVYFADIRGFTTVTDESQARAEEFVRTHQLPAQEAESYLDAQARQILATVNLYLGVVADKIKQRNGTFDKYIGDCAMAFWGAPTPNDRHAADCVLAAIDSQRAIYALNLERAEENRRREQENAARLSAQLPPVPRLTLLALGSGINTGAVTVGLMGSAAHGMNYTVFGREVNLASRLEGLSGRSRIVISESTYAELQRLAPELASICEPLPPVAIKGFRDQVQVYEVHWRKLDESTQSYDTRILTGGTDSPSTDFRLP